MLGGIPRHVSNDTAAAGAAGLFSKISCFKGPIAGIQSTRSGAERMTDELLSLRAVLLSASQNDHDMFRQAAATARLPIEIVECKSVAGACQAAATGADLVFIDGAIAHVATTQVVAVARAQGKPPFLMLLAA